MLGSAAGRGATESPNPSESSNTEDRSNPSSAAEKAPNCECAFAKIPGPYIANTLLSEAGAFIAHAGGLVFSVLADSTRTNDIADYPMLLLKSDLSGNLETLYTCNDAEMIGTVVKPGDDAFVVLGLRLEAGACQRWAAAVLLSEAESRRGRRLTRCGRPPRRLLQ